jgi:hypothetical protein
MKSLNSRLGRSFYCAASAGLQIRNPKQTRLGGLDLERQTRLLPL